MEEGSFFEKTSTAVINDNVDNIKHAIVKLEKLQCSPNSKAVSRNKRDSLYEKEYGNQTPMKLVEDAEINGFYNLRNREEVIADMCSETKLKMYRNKSEQYSLNDDSDENCLSSTGEEISMRQQISCSYKTVIDEELPLNNNLDIKLGVYRNKKKISENTSPGKNTGLYEKHLNNCSCEDSNRVYSEEELNSDKKEMKSLESNCFYNKLHRSESSTKLDKSEIQQLKESVKTNKMKLSAPDKVKQKLHFEEKLTERELEALANDDLSSDSELEDKNPATRPLSSSSSDIEYQEERPESPDIKTMEAMIEKNTRLIEESLARQPMHVRRTLNLELLNRSPVKLKLKRKIESPPPSETSLKKSPRKDRPVSGSGAQDSPSSNRKLLGRDKIKAPKWIITNIEDSVEKGSDKGIKKKRNMLSWEVVIEKPLPNTNGSKCNGRENDATMKTPLRDRSKIKLPARLVDNDSKSETVKSNSPKCNTSSPKVTVRGVSKEKENKTPHKTQEDSNKNKNHESVICNNNSVTPPLRDRSKIKLPARLQGDDSKVTSGKKDITGCSVSSRRVSSRIARQLENKAQHTNEEGVTPDKSRSAMRSPLRDRTKIKLPSWLQDDEYKFTPGKNSSPKSSVNSPRISTRIPRQLKEDFVHATSNSVSSTPKRGLPDKKHRPLSFKKKKSSRKDVDSDSDSSESDEGYSDTASKKQTETPSKQVNIQCSTPRSSKRCYEKKINITTPVSRKSEGRILLTPKIAEKNRNISGKTPSTPLNSLDEARVQLHISTVPESLPCRQKEFKNIQGFLTRKIDDHAGGSMYISGMPGTGKTATVHAVVRELQQAADNNDMPKFDFVEVNGLKLTEPRQAYVRILQSLTGQRLTAEQAQSLLEKRFSGKNKKSVVLFVDELDYLCNRRQDVVYNILDWPTKRNSGLVVLTVSNTMDLPERTLKGRVTSRMGLTRLTFQPYTYHQLQEIVLNRLAGNNCFHPDAIQLVARKVAAVSGDARRALDICRRATELVTDNEQVTVKHVEVALNQIFTGPRVVTIRNCSRAAQLVLRALRDETQRTGVEETNVIQIYNHLVNICTLEGLPVPKVGDILSICTALSLLGLVIAEKGRPDIMRKLSLNVSSDDIHYALSCTSL